MTVTVIRGLPSTGDVGVLKSQLRPDRIVWLGSVKMYLQTLTRSVKTKPTSSGSV